MNLFNAKCKECKETLKYREGEVWDGECDLYIEIFKPYKIRNKDRPKICNNCD